MRAENFLYWIPLLPLIGAAINGLVGKRLPRRLVGPIACIGPLAAFGLAVAAFLEVRGLAAGAESIRNTIGEWIRVADLRVSLGFSIDRLGAVMALVVTGVGSLIHLYSMGYMGKDPGYPRFFAYLNLFMAAMLVLILADNLVLLFLGWEGVGLCSYLLIGFWYEDLANVSAGRKAFVVNRIGDFGFALGMFLIFTTFQTFDLQSIHDAALKTPALVSFWIPLLLFIGATGKSAQIPLYVWLPDAMAGPTPVSALIHAATMVTSGVYLLARLNPVFSAAPQVMEGIAVIGALTAFIAGFIALSQFDIKKVLAYSTVSQLGYMFIAAGLGAWPVAVFHLVTHAFFKGLLFLGAGAVIHSLHHEQDLRRMGGLRKKLPVTFWTMLAGALAIAGCPPLAGFFSKDAILLAAMERALGAEGGWTAGLIWVLGLLTAAMTSFYIFRLIYLAFLGHPRQDAPDDHGHGHGHGHGHASGGGHQEIHESPRIMLVPLVVLAVLSAAGGFLDIPAFLQPHAAGHEGSSHHLAAEIIGASLFAAGVLGVWLFFVKAPALRLALVEKNPIGRRLARLSSAKLYMDELYRGLFVKPLDFLAEALFLFIDRLLIDGLLVSGSGLLARFAGGGLRRLQSGKLPAYAGLVVVGALALLIWMLFGLKK